MNELTPYLPGILMAYAAFMLGIFSPGPNILAVIGTSMSIGRRRGVFLALGIASGSLCWAMLTVAGLSTLLNVYAGALVAIKVLGGCYLLWLGFKALRSAASSREVLPAAERSGDGDLRYWFRGLSVQMTNPKAALSWIAIMSLGFHPDAPWWVAAVIVVGTTLLSVLMHLAYALAFSTARMVRYYRAARRWIQTAFGLFFCFAGIRLLTSRL
jgi:threonine/homoserine/homoserine lactone efflux protein